MHRRCGSLTDHSFPASARSGAACWAGGDRGSETNKLKTLEEPQIYMWSGARELFLARHDFYIEQVKVRVLGGFDNMEEEANRVAEEVYDRIGSAYSDGNGDMATAAETALEHGQEFYMLLSDMKTQTTLGSDGLSLSPVGKRLPGIHGA